jgi:hypothetical protein
MLRSAHVAKEAQEKLSAIPAASADADSAVTAANALLLQAAVSSHGELTKNGDALISALAAARDRAFTLERAVADASSKVVACAPHRPLQQQLITHSFDASGYCCFTFALGTSIWRS